MRLSADEQRFLGFAGVFESEFLHQERDELRVARADPGAGLEGRLGAASPAARHALRNEPRPLLRRDRRWRSGFRRVGQAVCGSCAGSRSAAAAPRCSTRSVGRCCAIGCGWPVSSPRRTAEWERAAAAAAAWNARACAAAGPRALRLAALRRDGTARITVTRRNILGVVVPESATVEGGGPAEDASSGGAAVRLAAEAHAEALSAAAAVAALRAAHEAIEAELARTVRRLRAIEHRWLPAHEAELHRLELALEESELADIVGARWAVGRNLGRG